MLDQKQSEATAHHEFKEGMTLDQYLSGMKTLPKQDSSYQKIEENLYETSRGIQHQKYSNKIIPYEIRESDQDNYDESLDASKPADLGKQKNSMKLYKQDLKFIPERASVAQAEDLKTSKNGHNRDFRVRRQSNSPYKQAWKQAINFSPNKIFSQTLHAQHDWRIHKDPQSKTESTSSTIYGKFIKGFKNSDKQAMKPNEREKYFRKKNTREMEHLAKYERELYEKYEKFQIDDLINMRIQGVQDRLCERKLLNGRKIV